ncbi:MAG: stage V sporulation protein D, partial [Oscillospiraceae bacterium]|nr:stage V sporulation protein D [Oscillospiraceae bacterium]
MNKRKCKHKPIIDKAIKRPTPEMSGRMLVMFMVLAVGMLAVTGVLGNLQIAGHEKWQTKTLNQLLRDTVIAPRRGTIYDKDMNVLAQSANVWMLTIDPAAFRKKPKVENPKDLPPKKDWPLDETKVNLMAAKLEEVLGYKQENFRKRCERDSSYEIIDKAVEKDARDTINNYIYDLAHPPKNPDGTKGTAVNISGVNFTVSNKRYYTYDNMASSVIGFVNQQGEGASGIESKYENVLKGVPGKIVVAKDGNKNDLPFIYEKEEAETQGSNLVLTIKTDVQLKLEKHLRQAVSENKVQNKAAGIVMDVNTGEILAMATIPDFSLNDPYTLTDPRLTDTISAMPAETDEDKAVKNKALYTAQQKQWQNKAILDTLHPGSIFKPVTVAAALEENKTTVNATFDCPGYIMVGKQRIACHKASGHGHETLVQGMENSCNPVFISLGLKMGVATFSKYFKAFGLAEPTGVDLPGEAKGIYYPESTMKQIDLATAAFGQSFTITPMQMITATCAVANGGYMVQPHVVSKILDDEGNAVDTKNANVKRQVISKDTSDIVRSMMERVVSNGTGKNAYLEGYRIAGKTGTSEKLKESQESGVKKYIASFCGFAPADDPKVAVLVMLDEPTGASHMGGAIAAPVVKEIMADILPLLGVEPVYNDNDMKNRSIAAPNVINTAVKDV